MKRLMLLVAAVGLYSSASAEIVLPKILGSNMVVQQQSDINLWGNAKPNSKVSVSVSWAKKKVETKSDSDGKWSVTLRTPDGSFDPQTITISDGDPITLENVLIGDVWVCSGQSNMEMPMRGFGTQPVENSTKYIMRANKEADKLRLFTVERNRSFDKNLDDCKGQWECASPESVSGFSATGYFFGHALSEAIDVPIGLITTNWGGTRVETWMPLDDLKACVTPQQYEEKQHNHELKPSELYCAMIAPLTPFKAKGFTWYQGESNLGDIDHYDIMMAKMVESWRKAWGDTNNSMPFYYVQIAPYAYSGVNDISYPLFVESQLRALDRIPNSGMAGTTDIGEAYLIHPTKKEGVGERLAALALSNTYGCGGFDPNVPRIESSEIKDGKVMVKLSHTPEGLDPWTRMPITGFEIAGADRVFHPAKAWISDGSRGIVTIQCDEVKEPVAARYAFRNFVPANLKNTFGVPVAPFRTDNWNDVK